MPKQIEMEYKGNSTDENYARFYPKGGRNAWRLPIHTFPDKKPMPSFTVIAAEGYEFSGPRVKMTAQERKDALAKKPKLTAAEELAKFDELMAKRKARLLKKAAAEQAKTNAPAEPEPVTA